MVFLKAMCVNYQRLLRQLDKKLNNKDPKTAFCEGCHKNLNSTLSHHRKNQAAPAHVSFKDDQVQGEKAPVMPVAQKKPIISEVDVTEKKRSKLVKPVRPTFNESKKAKSKSKKESVSEKRQTKVDDKSNKGLITSATMLSVVGLLNYMGSGEVPVCDYSLI